MHEWNVLIDLKCLSMFCGWDLNYTNRLGFKVSCWNCLGFMKLCFEFENMSCWNYLGFMKKLCFEWFQSVRYNVGFV
jgi:hypothetical protein